MPDSRLKCAEYTQLGQACVNMSQESLDRTQEEYQKKVDNNKKLLAAVISRLLQNKKILKQAEEQARRKALCLASDIEAASKTEAAQDINCPATSISVAFSPTMQATISMLDASVAKLSTSEGAVSSS